MVIVRLPLDLIGKRWERGSLTPDGLDEISEIVTAAIDDLLAGRATAGASLQVLTEAIDALPDARDEDDE